MSVLIGTPLDDTLTGEAGTPNSVFGETAGSLSTGRGGNDTLRGGADTSNTIVGDAGGRLLGAARGGDDALIGGNNAQNRLQGDAGDNIDFGARGGNDTITGGDNSHNVLTGDAPNVFNSPAGNDVIVGGARSFNLGLGDFFYAVNARAGNDRVIGGDDCRGAKQFNDLLGDGDLDHSIGGDDVVIGGANSLNQLFGDGSGLARKSIGGDDLLIGGARSDNWLVGDTGSNATQAGGACGADRLLGGDHSSNTAFGDSSATLTPDFTAGDDFIVGGADSNNLLIGDAHDIDRSRGGDDILIGGAGGSSQMFGDADNAMRDGSAGGNDLLISGTGVDHMWGDAKLMSADSTGGRDVFRFLADSGNDTIHDFERGKDLIEVNASLLSPASSGTGTRLAAFAALASSSVGKLAIEERDANDDGAPDSIVHFDAKNSVTVLGVTGLTEEDFVAIAGISYVLFTRTSTGGGHRDDWVGSEANSQPSATPGNAIPASAFDADLATSAGTVLEGPGAADYAADGILQNVNLAMFNLTESSPGTFATGAPADLAARIAAGTPFFGSAKTDLDPAQSDIDLAAGKLHLAQTDKDWNGIKNLEISLDSATSFRDIRLENFVDTRLKIGDVLPDPDSPQGAVFDVQVLGAKRGEIDASHAPQAIDLLLTLWTNAGGSQNSFDIKGSIFGDSVTIEPGQVVDSQFGQSESWYAPIFFGPEEAGVYLGSFTTVFANLGAGSDQILSKFSAGVINRDGSPFLESREIVWGGTGDDVLVTGHGADKLFGDNGSGSSFNPDPVGAGGGAGNDHLDGGAGADWIEGNGDSGVVVLLQEQVNLITNGSFEEFDRIPDAETISHQGGKWFTFQEVTIDNVPGWARDEDEPRFGGPIELQTNAVGGLAAFDGLIKLELDSHPDFGENSFTFLRQGVPTVPDTLYHVSFAYAPRPDAPPGSSAFEFTLSRGGPSGNVNTIEESIANDQPGWHLFEADFIGAGQSSGAGLTFFPSFPLDTFGAFIDDVRVTQERTIDLSFAGDIIDCGTHTTFEPRDEADFDPDTVNFNAGDGFDVVLNFRPGIDVLRIEDVGPLTTEAINSSEGAGTLVQNGAGSVFLVGVTTPLGQTAAGGYLLLS